MNILVCSRVSFPALQRYLPDWNCLNSLGHSVSIWPPVAGLAECKEPDVVFSMSVSVMEETFEAMQRYPKALLFCYNWDCYEWVWDNPRAGEYDYHRYGDLLKRANLVWVPSLCTGLRAAQWWGLDQTKVILSSCPYWDYPETTCDECSGNTGYYDRPNGERYLSDPEDGTKWRRCVTCDGRGKVGGTSQGDYALCALREIPDPWWGKFEAACEKLGIPYRMPKHELSYEEYQATVANCRFLVSPLYELSTGGLTLIEGYYLGKPCLLSNSRWHGGSDYFGPNATYFEHGNEQDFMDKLLAMWQNPPQLDVNECQRWVKDNFSDRRMIEDMLNDVTRYQLIHRTPT